MTTQTARTGEPAQAEPILRVEDLVKTYASSRRRAMTAVLRGVSFEIGRGETLGLVGESGSGKSTTGRCIVRLTDPTAGRITFDGVDLTGLKGRDLRVQRRKLQMVFQDPASSLDSRMTILQSVEEPLHIHHIGHAGSRRARALAALERVGLLERHALSKPHALSGGQQQRAAIARALVTEPDLIVLDEPVSALDVSVRAQVLNLLKDLQRELGISYLFIVHDLAIAEYFSDRVVVLYGGQVMETGSARALFTSPSHPYTDALLSAIPDPDPDPRAAPEGPPPIAIEAARESSGGEGCAFADRCLVRAGRSICVEKPPPLVRLADDHWSACHFVTELRPASSARMTTLVPPPPGADTF
jgi:oligopeptide/dipeptide ABC transporter ATP-binding protein